MSYATIRPAIKTLLDGLSTLSTVYDYHILDVDGYPAATFEPSDLFNDSIDFSDNIRDYQFRIHLHQEVEVIGRDEAVRILAAAVDELINAFDADPQLSGNCDLMVTSPGQWGTYEKGQGSVLFATVTVSCKIEVQVIT